MPLPIMKTPAEFIDFYYKQLKLDLGNDNIKLSKTGFMGFLLNVLGNTQFDAKQYYDSLFVEAFPVLAQDDKNLHYHAITNGYVVPLATAASVTSGIFKLDLAQLPTTRPGILSRVISFGSDANVTTVAPPLEIDVGGVIYTVGSYYLLTAKIANGGISSYFFEARTIGNQINGGVQLATPQIPVVNASQYKDVDYSETVPFYPLGSHYRIIIAIPASTMVSKVTASVTSPGSLVKTQMIVDTNKEAYTGADNVIFYRIQADSTVLVELGSGLKGTKILSGSLISVTVSTTVGTAGNISPPGQIAKIATPSTALALVTDTYPGNTTVVTNVDVSKLLIPDTIISSGGIDELTGATLRAGLMRYIQTRDSVVSQTDYNNILSPIFKHYAISFNKSKLANNTVSLYVPLFDKYSAPIKTSTINFTKADFEASVFQDIASQTTTVFEPTVVQSGSTYISPFYYKYDNLFNMYFAYVVNQNLPFTYTSSTTNTNQPNITLSLNYNHNTISPYTILTISSYEDITPYIGTGVTTINFVNLNLSYTTGITSASRSSNYISNIVKHSGIQSTLSSAIPNVVATATDVIHLVSTAGFPLVGSIVIGTEDIGYTGKDDSLNILTGITRAVNNTTLATHPINAAVYDITINAAKIEFILGRISSTLTNSMTLASTVVSISDTSLFPPSGTIIIGSEEISYSNITGLSLNGIVRAVNGTSSTTHSVGDIVNEKNSNLSPLPSEILGLLDAPTQIEIILDNSSQVGGFRNQYIFDVVQAVNINDYLQIKQYNINGIQTSVALAVVAGDISITVNSTSGFPISGLIRIDNEEILYSSTTATTFNGLSRGSNSTVDIGHLVGSIVIQVTSSELAVPVIENNMYLADPQNITSSIINNYQSTSLTVNRSISDEIQLRLLNTSYIDLKFLNVSIVSGNDYVSANATSLQVNAPNGLTFPLKVSMSLVMNRSLISSTSANVPLDIDNLTLSVAQELTNKFTGTQIRISNADIIFLAKQIPYVDDVKVSFTDSSVVPVPISRNEVHVKPEIDILSGMSKLDRIDYVPVLWHWDVNNINVSYTVI